MRLGVNIWSFPKGIDVVKAMEFARRIGYQGFELAIALDHLEMDLENFKKMFRELGERARSIGIEIPSIATGLFWRFNPIAGGESLEKALRVVELECIAASEVGAKVVLVVPGSGISELTYDQHFERATEFLRKASDIAKNYGITVGVENVWNRVFAGPKEFKQLLESVARDNVKAYLDVGNTLPHSLPEHWIDVLGRELIVQVHVKDFSVADLRFGVPLSGEVNWYAVASRLKSIGYDGWVVAEVPPYRGDPFKAVEDTYTSLTRIFG